uniref:Somatostatin/Cortistatin C-terminal domain-containing protein n=1 Tax=Cyclopterus lumpus TaxID=8103 RepID=A0A8C2ZFP1_CYCLU
MLGSEVQVLLVVLFSSGLLVQVSGAPRADMLTLGAELDLAHLLLLKFMSELTDARGGEMLPELEGEGGGEEGIMRRHLPLTQRERKAGCRNFFWKTFTSC